MNYLSQAGQDKWVCETLNFKQNGFFVDVGAHDGVGLSNTYVLEKSLQWKGICIEANPHAFWQLVYKRSSRNVCCAVTSYEGFCGFHLDKIVSHSGDTACNTLHNILVQNSAPAFIDYISLDIEGAEYDVLKSFPFDKWDVELWTIEHNLYMGDSSAKDNIHALMVKNNYERVVENVTFDGINPFEDWYRKKR